MQELNKTLEYLPSSLSNNLMMYQPIPVSSPQRYKLKDIKFDTKIKNIPKDHYLEKSFRPYFRASKHVNIIKNMYTKYCLSEFDICVEDQNKFLHESPRNVDYKASRNPGCLNLSNSKKRIIEKKSFKIKRKSNVSRFPPINDELSKRFDIQLSNFSISNTKLKMI